MVSYLNQRYKFQANQAPFNSYCTITEYMIPYVDVLK